MGTKPCSAPPRDVPRPMYFGRQSMEMETMTNTSLFSPGSTNGGEGNHTDPVNRFNLSIELSFYSELYDITSKWTGAEEGV